MLRFRDTTTKYVILLGALFFLFISSSTQACVLTDHDCVNSMQMHAPAPMGMQCHIPMPEHVHAPANGHFAQASPDMGGECCHLIPADLGDFAKVQISNPSAQQFSSDWFQHQLSNAFYSFYSVNFVQDEIMFPPWQTSSVVSSSPISSCNAGRAPPSSLLA